MRRPDQAPHGRWGRFWTNWQRTQTYIVQRVLEEREGTVGPEYRTTWEGWDGDESWEPEAHLRGNRRLNEFLQQRTTTART